MQWMWQQPRRAEDLGCGPGPVTMGTSPVPHQKVCLLQLNCPEDYLRPHTERAL